MKVTLIARTELVALPQPYRSRAVDGQLQGSDAAQLIEFAGRLCYDSFGKGRPSNEFHANILASGHGSVTEHASFSFLVEGVSRNLTHELVRHRHLAFSQRSTRFCDESEAEVAWHPLLGGEFEQTRAMAVGEGRRVYSLLYDLLYRWLGERGVSQVAARKQARGAARGALPSALATALVATGNVRAWRGVIEQRATEFADAEIRLLANAFYEQLLAEVPEYFADYERYEHPLMAGVGYGLKTLYRKI